MPLEKYFPNNILKYAAFVKRISTEPHPAKWNFPPCSSAAVRWQPAAFAGEHDSCATAVFDREEANNPVR